MYKAIFIDIDGTLQEHKMKMSQRAMNAIENLSKKGIIIVIASGRPRKYVEDISRKCFASRYIISSNGSEVYDYIDKKTIYISKMDRLACENLYKIAEKNNIRITMACEDEKYENESLNGNVLENKIDPDIKRFLDTHDIKQCVVSDFDFDKMKNMKKEIEQVKYGVEIKNQSKSLIDDKIAPQGAIYYDIANKEVSKGNAIEKLCQYLGIDLKDTMAIGDDFNDISMFRKVGYAVAMGNASQDAKNCADEVIQSLEEDGAAIFLEKIYENIAIL
jgi:Cof subfamily protein (haloacid dehalogenase superfamily)